jgi:hypothetical protein
MTVFNSQYPVGLNDPQLLSELVNLTALKLISARLKSPQDVKLDERLYWTRAEVRGRQINYDDYDQAIDEADRIAWEAVAQLRR